VKFWTTPTSKCASQSAGCVPYYRWVSDYIGVIGGR
jgi:putative spermidine/putrescine transport system substrate-binding protein